MDQKISKTGGVNIGWFNATWPFATLTVSKSILDIKLIWSSAYRFKPEEIILIEPYIEIPFLGWGIKINHIVPKYPKKIIFWCFGNPHKLIKQIDNIGFIPQVQKK